MAIMRVGECLRCGTCCFLCEYIALTFERKAGEYKRLHGICKIFGSKERREKGCDDYPTYPDRLLGRFCGFRFIDEEGRDVTTYRENKTLLRLDVPKVNLVIRDDE